MNISIKSKVRHWFNFYRLALQSTDPEIIENCKRTQQFYKPWGEISRIKYDDWWKTHANLFHLRQKIEILDGEFKTESNSLYLKIVCCL